MLEIGSIEWQERLASLRADELTKPLEWWYLSFAGDEGFLGGAYVQARGILTAVREASRLGINPGGEVKAGPMLQVEFERCVPADMRNRILTREELENG